jgi:P-type conjugative transfer protein TrbL
MRKAILSITVLLIVLSSPAHAADILDQLMTSYRTVSAQVIGNITTPLLATFFTLSVIAVAVELSQQGVAGHSEQWLPTLVRWVLSVGLGIWLISNAANFSHLILSTMGYLAGLADSRTISPTTILHQGITASHAAADAADAAGWHFGSAIAFGIGGFVVLGCFIVIAAAIVIQTIEFYLVSCICLVMAPLIGLPWTRDLGVSYWTGLLRTAVGVFATAVIAVVAFNFTDQWLQTVKATNNILSWDDLGLLIAQSATLAYAVVRVPATCMRAVGSPSTMSGMGFFANTTYLARSSISTVTSVGRGAGNVANDISRSPGIGSGGASRPPASLGSRFSGGATP